MKTNQYPIPILLLAMVLLNATACKKQTTCVCTSEFFPEPIEYDYGKMKKANAYEQCKAANTYYEKSQQKFGWACKIK